MKKIIFLPEEANNYMKNILEEEPVSVILKIYIYAETHLNRTLGLKKRPNAPYSPLPRIIRNRKTSELKKPNSGHKREKMKTLSHLGREGAMLWSLCIFPGKLFIPAVYLGLRTL